MLKTTFATLLLGLLASAVAAERWHPHQATPSYPPGTTSEPDPWPSWEQDCPSGHHTEVFDDRTVCIPDGWECTPPIDACGGCAAGFECQLCLSPEGNVPRCMPEGVGC